MSRERPLEVPVLLGTGRVGRQSVHVARWVLDRLARRPGVAAAMLDLGEFAFPVMTERLSQAEAPPPRAEEFARDVARADGLLIVTPEYKGGYPGGLKNALDYLDAGVFRRKPIGIVTVSAGGFGGLSCLGQLRAVCLAMGGLPIPASLPISHVEAAFDGADEPGDPKLSGRLEAFLDEHLWYTRALARQRRIDEGEGGGDSL